MSGNGSIMVILSCDNDFAERKGNRENKEDGAFSVPSTRRMPFFVI